MARGEGTRPLNRVDILYRVIKVSSQIRELSSVLEILMDHLIELLGAERGFIMLYNSDTGVLEFRTARNMTKGDLYASDFQVSRSIVFHCYEHGTSLLTSNAQTDSRFQEASSIRELGLRSVICAPLPSPEGPLGVLYVDNRARLGAFHKDDLTFLESFASQAAGVIDRANLQTQHDRVRELFGRYVASSVVDEILNHPGQALMAHRKRVTVMFSDLRGFSRVAEVTEPSILLGFLNDHFQVMTAIIYQHDGTVLSFMGDGLLAVFGAPLDIVQPEAQAVTAAQAMITSALERQIRIGVGLSTGEAVIGDLGTPEHRNYTVIGDVVNTAARLEKLTKAKGEAILTDQPTAHSSKQPFRSLGEVHLDGRSQPIEIFTPRS